MSYNQGHNSWNSYYETKKSSITTNNTQNAASAGKTKMKSRRITYSAQHLLQSYANEQIMQSQKVKSKNNGSNTQQQQQQPAFKLIDLEAEKSSSKLADTAAGIGGAATSTKNPTDTSWNLAGVLPLKSSIPNNTFMPNQNSGSNPSYSFSAAKHLDNIMTLRNPVALSQAVPTIKPPTVKLSSVELGNVPQTSSNPLIPSRSEMDQSLIKLANEKKSKFDIQQKKKLSLRVVGDIAWEDGNLLDFDPNDFRIFVGDLGHEVTDEMLRNAFSAYPSLQKVRVIRRPGARKNRGYGFVSFKNPNDYLKAMKEMNGKYIGVRPIKCRKSTWKDRSLGTVVERQEEKRKHGYKV